MNVVDSAIDQPQPDRSPRGQRWWLLFLLLLLVGMCALGATLFGQRRSAAPEPEFIPVSLHSNLAADYRANPNPSWLPGVRLEIIWDVIYDRDPGADDFAARKAALLTALQTPVAVVTSSACQGQYVTYATQDTWIDSTDQTAAHGADTSLQIGRAGDGTKQVLLYFPLPDTLPAGSFIDRARLELEREAGGGQLPPASIQIYSLSVPFSEMTTTWANQPEPYLPYRSLEGATASFNTWDVTDIVQDWLLDYHENAGILLLPAAASPDFNRIYFSREAGSADKRQVSGQTDRPGPRLIIDCGSLPPEPEAVAVVTISPTPTPIPTDAEAGPTPSTAPPVSTATPISPLPTQPAPEPTLPASSPTAIPPLPSPIALEPTLPPPSPTTPPLPPPPPTEVPTDDNEPDPPPTPRVSINDVTITEGDTGRVTATFNVNLSATTDRQVTVDFTVVGNTATASLDFDGSSDTLTFPPGSTRQTITVNVLGDLLDENNETFFVNLFNASGATFGDDQGQGTIIDDDPPPALIIDDVAVAEGDAGTVEALFTVSLSTASGLPVTVAYSTANGSAAAGEDYQSASGFLSFPPGTISQTLPVRINSDQLFEPNETVLINLSNPTNAIIADAQAIGTILNDDELTISIADVTVTEGSGAVDAVFLVGLSIPSAQPVTVDYATADDTAISPADYTAIPLTTLAFNPGVITQPITVTVQGDLLDEPDETFFVNLSNPSSGTLLSPRGLGTIIDDDNPTLSINDVSVTEGNAGLTSAVFTVTLSAAGVETATVNYGTASGTATAGSDYVETRGTLTFSIGITQQSFTVQVIVDTITEPNETFFVNLSSPVNATISDGQGVGAIVDDDLLDTPCGSPTITLDATQDSWLSAATNQQDSNYGSNSLLGVKPAPNLRHTLIDFDLGAIPPNSVVSCATLLLNQTFAPTVASDQLIYTHRVITSWTEMNVTWLDRITDTPWNVEGGDYDPSVENTFVPDRTGLRVVDLKSLTQFWVDHPNENFGLLLRSTTIGDNGVAEFSSREAISPTLRPRLVIEYIPTLSINDVTVTEGEGESDSQAAVFTVTLSSASSEIVTVDFATADNTATLSNNDYEFTSGTLTFTPGITAQTVTVQIVGDTNDEPVESFLVNLANPLNAAIQDGQGEGFIEPDIISGLSLPAQTNQIYLPLIMK